MHQNVFDGRDLPGPSGIVQLDWIRKGPWEGKGIRKGCGEERG